MKILVVLPRFPYPLEKGDKLRAYYQIKELSKQNDVYLFCASHCRVLPEHIKAVQAFCKEICLVQSPKLVNYKNIVRNYFSTKSLQIGYWDSLKVRKAFKLFEKKVRPDVLYSQMVRTMPWVSHSDCPKVMDFQDALSMNTERRMEMSRGLWHYILHFEFKMLRSSEYNAFKIFDALTIISESDCDAIPHRRNDEIRIVPNGVDMDFFHPLDSKKECAVVFCGNMSYEPNVHAARFLTREVMPMVWAQFPDARLLLAGASPKHAVEQLAKGDSRVSVSGFVEDIRQCYASAQAFCAPMLSGSGLQNKLLEAMAMKLPCVTTSLANNSLQAEPEKEVLVGDTASQLADHIKRLLRDEALRDMLSENGHRFVCSRYSWHAAGEKLQAVLQEVADKGDVRSLRNPHRRHRGG